MLGLAAGMLVTIPAGLLAVGSSGAGHGTYYLARILYPVPMLLWRAAGGAFEGPLIALSLAQFPSYGAVLGATLPWRRARTATACAILMLHLGVAAAGLVGLVKNAP